MDRVAIYDTTQASPWENHEHYSGGYGGYGRWLLSKVMPRSHKHTDKHNARAGQPQHHDRPQDKYNNKPTGRTLLGAQQWETGVCL